jgi:invasion protein IalB
MRLLLLALILSLLSVAAFADDTPKLQATIKDWSVLTREVNGDTLCYVRSFAKDKSPQNVNHGEVAFFVGTWASGAARDQPSLMTGYPIRAKTPPKAKVGNTSITMFSAGVEAFVESEKDERRLVRAMKKGSRLRIEAMSERGTATAYEFSLSGITAALRKADGLCK